MSSVAQNTISKPKRGWVRKTGIIIIPILLLIGLIIGLGAVSTVPEADKTPREPGVLNIYIALAVGMIGLAIWYVFDRPPSWVKYLQSVVAGCTLIAGFTLFALLLNNVLQKPKERERSFNTLAVLADYANQESVQLHVNTQGEVRPQIEIDFVPQVGGKIVFVSPNFIEGGVFRKGETLVRIEDADFQVAVIRAEASVAQAQQALTREEAEGEIAKRDFEELGRPGEASDLALRKPQIAQARASLQAANAELEAAKLNLSRTSVKAPFSGRVREKSSDIGQFVNPGARLARIFSSNISEVRLPLSDEQLAKLDLPLAFVAKSRADAPKVTLSTRVAGKLQSWEAEIMRTDPTFDTQTRSLFAIAEVVDPYGNGRSDDGVPLAPGLFVDAAIAGKSYEDIIVFPRDGLRPGDEVYVVDDKGKGEIRSVSVLDTTSERAFLTSGINPGELVVLSPMERSRVEYTLKVLDANDPNKVLVDPPRPGRQKPGGNDGNGTADKGKGDKPKKPRKKPDAANGETPKRDSKPDQNTAN